MDARLVQPRTYELNLRFDTPQQALRRSGRVLRLRRDASMHLTYKGAGLIDSGALTRREIEFAVDDFEAARDLLLALGFEVSFVYEKYRQTYAVDRLRIMLDELPYGSFVEIEGEVSALKPMAERLGLSWDAAIPSSYHDLFEVVRQARQMSCRDLTFENFASLRIQPRDLGVRPADQ